MSESPVFDDKSKVQQFIDASLNYGKVRDRDGVVKFPVDCADASYCTNLINQGKSAYPYPEEWVSQHYIAMINEMTIARGKTQWQLIIQQDYTTIDIDVATTVWGGQRQDGVVTDQEAAGWVQEYLSIAKTFACCVRRIEVVDRQQMVVVITLDGELVSRPPEARQSVASGVFTSYASSLGECLRIVRFVDAAGNPLPDAYTNTLCR